MVVTLQIIGKKKSGKTSTMLRFIRAAKIMGLNVSTYKHTHHTVSMDIPGTDTYRFYEAGADQVAMQNDSGFFWHELREASLPLAKEIERFTQTDTDLILIEGFKAEHYPKILLLRPNDNVSDFEADHLLTVATIFPKELETEAVDFSTDEQCQIWLQNFYQGAEKHG